MTGGGLCLGGSWSRGSLSRRISVWEVSVWGRSVREIPPDRDPPYGNERAIRILLEYIIVIESVDFTKRTRQQIISFFLVTMNK